MGSFNLIWNSSIRHWLCKEVKLWLDVFPLEGIWASGFGLKMENNSAVALFFPSFVYTVYFVISFLWFMGELILLGLCLVCDTQHPEFHWWPIHSPHRSFSFVCYIGSSELLVQILVLIPSTQSTLHSGKHSSTAGHNAYSELSCNVISKCSVWRKKKKSTLLKLIFSTY